MRTVDPDICGFVVAWVGACKNKKPCTAKHANAKCAVCGLKATRECDLATQFICGVPLCAMCVPHTEEGKYGHTHICTNPVGIGARVAQEYFKEIAQEEDKVYTSGKVDKMEITLEVNHGWLCSRCGSSFAPHVDECKYCNTKTHFKTQETIRA